MNLPSRLVGVAKLFGGLAAVDGVTLQVRRGERRLLIGPNGAGKTTLFHCITGKLQATRGSVHLFGRDVTHEPEHRRAVAGHGPHLPDHQRLHRAHAAGEPGAGHRRPRPPQVGPAARGVGLWRCAARSAAKPADRGPASNARCCRCARFPMANGASSNSRWRLCMQPQVLFLDEPCAGLSPSERQRIAELIAGAARAASRW